MTPPVKCPECDEDVQVGTVGPAGIVQHQGKNVGIKPCDHMHHNYDTQPFTPYVVFTPHSIFI